MLKRFRKRHEQGGPGAYILPEPDEKVDVLPPSAAITASNPVRVLFTGTSLEIADWGYWQHDHTGLMMVVAIEGETTEAADPVQTLGEWLAEHRGWDADDVTELEKAIEAAGVRLIKAC